MFEDVLCVIPARGGSKGILHKNLCLLGSDPLFVHSVKHALCAGISSTQILVSSDDDEILQIAKSHNVIAHKRPDEISQDFSSTEDCLIDACHATGDKYKTVLTLQPTSPIRSQGRVYDALITYRDGDYDSLVSVTKFYNLFWYEVQYKGKYRWTNSYDIHNRPMRQSLDRGDFKYFENGNLYISNADMLLKTKCRLGSKVCVYPITELEGMQIDNHEDLRIFQQIFDHENWGLVL